MVPRNLSFRFTLVSYNILSQSLLNDHLYLYTGCNSKDLEWPRRGHRIVSELISNQADIICLQEVECEHLQSLFQPKLAGYGYECLYKKKTGLKVDGCAIFYKSKLFHLLNYKGIEFNRTDVTSLLNRDNVGIIAVLKPKLKWPKESQLVIANTHLMFNPRRSDIKLAQLRLFLSELEEISLERYDSVENKRYHHPTILCGDLNSVPGSTVNNFILKNQNVDDEQTSEPNSTAIEANTSSNGESENNNPTPIKETSGPEVCDTNNALSLGHTLDFKSVYPTQDRRGRPYVSTFSSCIVDYIFYTPRLRLESYRELLTEEELRDVGPIPNSDFPSDHLTLEAKFTLK